MRRHHRDSCAWAGSCDGGDCDKARVSSDFVFLRKYGVISPEPGQQVLRYHGSEPAIEPLGDLLKDFGGNGEGFTPDRDTAGSEGAHHEEVSDDTSSLADKDGLKEVVAVSAAGEIALACPCGAARVRSPWPAPVPNSPPFSPRLFGIGAGRDSSGDMKSSSSAVFEEQHKAAEEFAFARKKGATDPP